MKVNLPKFVIFLFCLFLYSSAYGQGTPSETNPWIDVTESAIQKTLQDRRIIPNTYRTTQLDLNQVTSILDAAPLRFSEKSSDQAVYLQMPHPEKGFITFQIWYAPVMHPDLAARYPEIRSFVGQGVEDPSAIVRFDLTPHGFHAMVRSGSESTIFIDPYAFGENQNYISYFKKDFQKIDGSTFVCEFDEYNKEALKEAPDYSTPEKSNGDCNLHTYRLALACTGEYAQFHGGTVPLVLAAMNTSMTRVNGIYETDITATMQLVPNNDQLVFLDAATDPYTNGSGGTMLGQNQTTCNNVIGSSNYDIGHVFSTGGGGVASLNSVCTSSKARGVTGQGSPVGDPFDVDYVAHEMGHQFGGRHTQNNSCNRDSNSSYEPGSASTIMGYAGICSPNVQSNSDAYFHINSVILMTNWSNGGGSCSVNTNTGNNAPVANAGSNYTIPKSTPFVMEGAASDADGDPLTYCWEQYDKEVANMPPQSTNTVGPAFRSLDPVSSPDRYLPNLEDLVNNVDPTWEELASVSRGYTWRLTVRDNNPGAGCTDDDESLVTVDGSTGPFLVTVPNTPVSWDAGTMEMVTWDVAGTTGGNVNAANVDIFLSTDGGFTYPITLATNTPNDGSHSVMVPNNSTTQARVMVRGSGSIFFDISNQNFTINGQTEDFGLTVTPPFSSVCQPAPVTYIVLIESIGGFTGPVSLSATDVPAGAEISFATNPVNAPGSSNMIVFNTDAVAPGNYTINVIGTGAPGMQEQAISLTILPGAPAPVSLLTPANGDVNVILTPVFGWTNSANADSYAIQVADNSDFVDPVIEETGIMNTVYPSPIALDANTKYFWRVSASNECGESGYGEPFDFTTVGGGSPLSIEVTGTDVTCFGANDGTATVTATGGSGVYTYLWSTGAETATIIDLEPGDYTVDVSDGINTEMGSITIEEPTEIIITGNVTDALGGDDGAIDVEVTGGSGSYSYSWSNGAETQDLTNLTPDSYTVTVMDIDGCAGMMTFLVGGPLSCDPWVPTGSTTTPHTATIEWLVLPNALLHRLRYRLADSDDPWINKSGDASLNEITVVDLLPLSTYEFDTKTKCLDGEISDWSSETYFFTTGDASTICDGWLADAVTVTTTSATVDWTAEPGATSYRLAYRPISGGPFIRIQTTSTNAIINDLMPGTTYEFKGKSLCPDGWSDWSIDQTFMTEVLLIFNEGTSMETTVKPLELFPNPVRESLEVTIYMEAPAQMLVHDYTGKVVWQAHINQSTETINVRNLPAGIYLLSVQGQDGTIQTERFIKSN